MSAQGNFIIQKAAEKQNEKVLVGGFDLQYPLHERILE
jgi:hypothetical protein